jgi:four helix bundle protein
MNEYRSLAAWQHAHSLMITTLRITDERNCARTRSLFEQIRRAAISVEANIVEGYALSTTPQLRRHLKIALASAAEAEALLRVPSNYNISRATTPSVFSPSSTRHSAQSTV